MAQEETRPESDRISKSKLAEALEGMRGLKRKETDDVSAKAAIRQMRRQIERLLKLEYTYEEISALLEQYDIFISKERLQYFLKEINKEIRQKNQSVAGRTPAAETQERGTDAQPQQLSEEKPVTQKSPRSARKQTRKQPDAKTPAETQLTNPSTFAPALISNDDL